MHTSDDKDMHTSDDKDMHTSNDKDMHTSDDKDMLVSICKGMLSPKIPRMGKGCSTLLQPTSIVHNGTNCQTTLLFAIQV